MYKSINKKILYFANKIFLNYIGLKAVDITHTLPIKPEIFVAIKMTNNLTLPEETEYQVHIIPRLGEHENGVSLHVTNLKSSTLVVDRTQQDPYYMATRLIPDTKLDATVSLNKKMFTSTIKVKT